MMILCGRIGKEENYCVEVFVMILSKGKRNLLIAVVTVIVLVAGLFGFRSYRITRVGIESTVEYLLSTYSSSTIDVDSFSMSHYDRVKDKRAFKRTLAKYAQKQVDCALFNETVSSSDEKMAYTTPYGFSEKLSTYDVRCVFIRLGRFFKEVGYDEDNALQQTIQDFYVKLADIKRTPAEGKDMSAQKSELKIAEALVSVLSEVKEYNQATNAFYQIPVDTVVTADEIADHYGQAIQLAYDAGDREFFSKTLSKTESIPELNGYTFIEDEKIVSLLVKDGGEVYTLKNGIGGYYDTNHHSDSKVDSITYYGDFVRTERYVPNYSSGGKKYDTSALTPGVWGALTSGQRNEILSANSSSGGSSGGSYEIGIYCQGNKSSVNTALAEKGYDYAYCNEDGDIVQISRTGLCYSGSIISGNFSALYQKMEDIYANEHSKEDIYAEYAGLFCFDNLLVNGKPVERDTAYRDFQFYSQFQMIDGKLYWQWIPTEDNLDNVDTIKNPFHSSNGPTFITPTLVEDFSAKNVWTSTEYNDKTITTTYTVTFDHGQIILTKVSSNPGSYDHELIFVKAEQ